MTSNTVPYIRKFLLPAFGSDDVRGQRTTFIAEANVRFGTELAIAFLEGELAYLFSSDEKRSLIRPLDQGAFLQYLTTARSVTSRLRHHISDRSDFKLHVDEFQGVLSNLILLCARFHDAGEAKAFDLVRQFRGWGPSSVAVEVTAVAALGDDALRNHPHEAMVAYRQIHDEKFGMAARG